MRIENCGCAEQDEAVLYWILNSKKALIFSHFQSKDIIWHPGLWVGISEWWLQLQASFRFFLAGDSVHSKNNQSDSSAAWSFLQAAEGTSPPPPHWCFYQLADRMRMNWPPEVEHRDFWWPDGPQSSLWPSEALAWCYHASRSKHCRDVAEKVYFYFFVQSFHPEREMWGLIDPHISP